MLNKNYIGHKFEQHIITNYYKCKKCNIRMYYFGETAFNTSEYHFYADDLVGSQLDDNMTCDNFIIKNIIE